MLIRAVLAALVSVAAPALASPKAPIGPTTRRVISRSQIQFCERRNACARQLKLLNRFAPLVALRSARCRRDRPTVCCCCRATPALEPTGCEPTLADELFKDGQPLDAGDTSSSSRTPSAVADRASPQWAQGNFPHYVPRHGPIDAPDGHRRAQGRPSASRDRQFARLHAQFHCGREYLT